MKTVEMPSLRVAEEITELVGETPILHLRKVVPAGAADVYAKLEYLNPGGSIKDRAALGMILKAEGDGRLKPGATIFEATAGNTGVGLALIGTGRGYKTVLAVPEGFSQEKVTLMEALGAEVIRTPKAGGMQAAIDYVKERAARTPNSFIAGQFENQDNPDFHYETTGREYLRATRRTGRRSRDRLRNRRHVYGVARYFKERNPKVLAIAVETEGSVLGGGPKGDHEVEGIGASFIPKTFDGSLADEIVAVTDRDAFDMVKKAGGQWKACLPVPVREQMFSRPSESPNGSARANGLRPSFPIQPSAICRKEFFNSARNAESRLASPALKSFARSACPLCLRGELTSYA